MAKRISQESARNMKRLLEIYEHESIRHREEIEIKTKEIAMVESNYEHCKRENAALKQCVAALFGNL